MKLLHFDRHGSDIESQLGLESRPLHPLPDRYHVHVCADCGCEFVCSDLDCDTDPHNYGETLHDCDGCGLDPRPSGYHDAIAAAIRQAAPLCRAWLVLEGRSCGWFVTVYLRDTGAAHRVHVAALEAAHAVAEHNAWLPATRRPGKFFLQVIPAQPIQSLPTGAVEVPFP